MSLSERSSRNAEASISEIREMFLSSIRVTDISRLKPKSTPHLMDELLKTDVDQRRQMMYKILKTIAPKIPLENYSLISQEK